jgi:hypothetical protein
MNGESHILVANLALALLPQKSRHILYPRWGGIEAGATLSDHFRIMWEPGYSGSKDKELVHRCYVDSTEAKNHGCITRALDHAHGTVSFINDYLAGDLDDAYTEDEFLENLGMFLGIESHHIADLCTPVHVGHKIDHRALGFKTLARFHNQVERDIDRFMRTAAVKLPKPLLVKFDSEYFWTIARNTYQESFLGLESLYKKRDETAMAAMAGRVLSTAVRHTADVWHTILERTALAGRKWSMQPLL